MSILASDASSTIQLYATQTGVRLTALLAKTSMKALLALIRQARQLLATYALSPRHVRWAAPTSLKALNRTGQDVHNVRLEDELIRNMRRYLARTGVTFALEHAPDGHTYVHFLGKDIDMIQHALTQIDTTLTTELTTHTPDTLKPDDMHIPAPEADTASPPTPPHTTPSEHPKPRFVPMPDDVKDRLTRLQTKTDVKQEVTTRAANLHLPEKPHPIPTRDLNR